MLFNGFVVYELHMPHRHYEYISNIFHCISLLSWVYLFKVLSTNNINSISYKFRRTKMTKIHGKYLNQYFLYFLNFNGSCFLNFLDFSGSTDPYFPENRVFIHINSIFPYILSKSSSSIFLATMVIIWDSAIRISRNHFLSSKFMWHQI